jgi:hypothetical protein
VRPGSPGPWPALLLLIGLGSCRHGSMPAPVAAPANTAVITISESVATGAWSIAYQLPTAVSALRFARIYEQRAKWKLVEASFRMRATPEGEVIERTDGQPFRAFTMDVPTYYKKPEKNYQLFIPYSDGGLLVYTGHFDVLPMAAPVWPLRFRLHPRPGQHLVLAGQVHTGPADWAAEGEGTYAYFGTTAPITTPELTAVVDRGFPSWLRTPVETLLPRVFALYTERTGQPLRRRPVVFLSYGPPPERRGVRSIGGGTLPGVLQQDVTLGLDYRQEGDPRTLEITLLSVAHEAAHLWNGGAFTHQVPGGDWMHEGGADAFAYRALIELGLIGQERYLAQLAEARKACAKGLKGRPLRESSRPGHTRNYYTCGFVIAALSEAATRAQDREADIFSFWRMLFSGATQGLYDDELYFRRLRALPNGAPVADIVQRLVREPLDDVDALLASAFEQAGLPP